MAVTLLQNILEKGVSSDASDIHIKEHYPIAYRIDGEMISSDFVPDVEMLERFISQTASSDQVDSFKKTGDLDISHYEDGVGRFRVNAHRQRNMLCLNFRYVKNKVMTFEQLGLPPVLKQISEYPRGIVILTGTTGSGKSTSLAAMLEHINATMRRSFTTVSSLRLSACF
jgi:twitching motility protein PilT